MNILSQITILRHVQFIKMDQCGICLTSSQKVSNTCLSRVFLFNSKRQGNIISSLHIHLLFRQSRIQTSLATSWHLTPRLIGSKTCAISPQDNTHFTVRIDSIPLNRTYKIDRATTNFYNTTLIP